MHSIKLIGKMKIFYIQYSRLVGNTYVPSNSFRLYFSSMENCLSGSRESRFAFFVESFFPNSGMASRLCKSFGVYSLFCSLLFQLRCIKLSGPGITLIVIKNKLHHSSTSVCYTNHTYAAHISHIHAPSYERKKNLISNKPYYVA